MNVFERIKKKLFPKHYDCKYYVKPMSCNSPTSIPDSVSYYELKKVHPDLLPICMGKCSFFENKLKEEVE